MDADDVRDPVVMSRATHARFLARQAERRRAAKEAAVRACGRCGSTEVVRQFVADNDPLGMRGSVWLCGQHAPAGEEDGRE